MFFTKVCGQVMEYNKQALMQLEMSDHVNSAGGRGGSKGVTCNLQASLCLRQSFKQWSGPG